MDEPDIDKEEIPVRYRKLFEQVQEQLDKVSEELERLESSGKADEYPVKHQKAVKKMEAIQDQMDDLAEAVQEFDQDDDRS